jgi:hypothetical protein
MISLATVIFLALIGIVVVAAWPTCETETSRWWLIGTMVAVPWLAWLYWIPRRMRHELDKRRVQRRGIRIESVRFWTRCQHSGSPIEQAIAPQVLAFFADTYGMTGPRQAEQTFAAGLHRAILKARRH